MEMYGVEMLDRLSNTISSFSTTSKINVNSLIREMKISKIELQSLIGNLKTFSSGSTFATTKVAPFSPFDRALFVDLFRDSFFRVQRFYGAMNAVGLAINSMISILGSEIDKLQNDIDTYEFFINNYNFLSGEDDLYNFNYIEKFNSMLNDYRYDGASFAIPDRDGQAFPVGGNGFVDSSSGLFKFGSNINFINVLDNVLSISHTSNYENFISSSTNFENVLNENLVDSWNVTIKSPTILTSNLSDYTKYIDYDYSLINGAQVLVEINFVQSVIMDTIRINPNFGSDFQILQISLNDIENNQSNLLIQPTTVVGVKEFSFVKRSVNKIIFIFNQPTYVRNKIKPLMSELNHKVINNFILERFNERNSRFSVFQDLVYWFFNKKTNVQKISSKNTEYDYYSNRFPAQRDYFQKLIEEEIFVNENVDMEYKFDSSGSVVVNNLIENMFGHLIRDSNLIKTNYYIESSSSSARRLLDSAGYLGNGKTDSKFSVKEQFYNYPIQNSGVSNAVQAMLVDEPNNFYEYQISIRSIDFIETIGPNVSKACFVSKKIPNNGQMLGLKAKIDIQNDESLTPQIDYDLTSLISYEFSISNAEEADLESDWYPLSFNDQNYIESEVVFFDTTNMTYAPRFFPVQDSIFLYRNGIICDPFKYSYNKDSNKISLLDRSLYVPNSIFCIKYKLDKTSYNPGEIDFIKQNILSDDVKPYTSSIGNGQYFSRSDNSNKVILDKIPYVDRRLARNAVYSQDYGTIFSVTTGYSPVKIKLNDGTFAINLTNYTESAKNVSFYSSPLTQFIQNGKNIVFNKPMTSPFIVYYDYSPNTIRFRLIARKNIPNLDIPIKIDSVLIKTKTLSYDSYYDKLNISFVGN